MPTCELCNDTGTFTTGGIDPITGHSVQTPTPCTSCGVRRPGFVCLCGSTKFKDAFLKAQKEFTLKGLMVLSVGFFGHADGWEDTEHMKPMLDSLHLRKIDQADLVFVLNVGGYIGESTTREIAYAVETRTPVNYLEPLTPPS